MDGMNMWSTMRSMSRDAKELERPLPRGRGAGCSDSLGPTARRSSGFLVVIVAASVIGVATPVLAGRVI